MFPLLAVPTLRRHAREEQDDEGCGEEHREGNHRGDGLRVRLALTDQTHLGGESLSEANSTERCLHPVGGKPEFHHNPSAKIANHEPPATPAKPKNWLNLWPESTIHSKAIGRPFSNGYKRNLTLLHRHCWSDFEQRNRTSIRTTKHFERCNEE